MFWSSRLARFLVAGTVVVTVPGATVTVRDVFDDGVLATILSPTPAILITSPARSSVWNFVPNPVTVVPEPAVDTVPDNENSAFKSVSAVKS